MSKPWMITFIVFLLLLAPARAVDPILARALDPILLDYLKGKKLLRPGEEGSLQNPMALQRLLRERTQGDLLDLGETMFQSFEASSRSQKGSRTWMARATEHFVLLVRTGSAAERDLDLIAGEAESTRQGIAELLGLEESLRVREEMQVAALPEGLSRTETRGRIPIFLHDNRASDEKGAIPKRSMGSATLGATMHEGTARLSHQIHLMYFNAFSLAVLQHEIAHLVLMLPRFDPQPLRSVTQEKDLKEAFMKGYRRTPSFLNEGMGDYAFYYRGFYARWGCLGSPESLAAQMATEGKLLSLRKLLEGEGSWILKNHKAYALGAATFLAYLQKTFGTQLLKTWLLQAGDKPVQDFERIFGLQLDVAEARWKAWLVEACRSSAPETTGLRPE